MDKTSLNLYYASMIIYLIGGVPLVLYTLIIRPIANLYNEPISSMMSPVFGNYAIYLRNLFIVSIVFVTASLLLYAISIERTRKAHKSLSRITVALPLILYIFGYVLLGVSGI